MRGDARTEQLIVFFRKYVGDKKIVIADASATSRSAISNAMVNLGARQVQISLCSDYEEAEEVIEKQAPKIVIADYDLGRKCGLDLLQKQRAKNPGSKDCLFALVTGNTSQSAVAKAAEEDVDTYILKPFTIDVLRNSLLRAVVVKVSPSDYVKTIEEGKDQMAAGKHDEAIAIFTKAKSLDTAPSLACFYLGQAQQMKKVLDGAKADYQSGLQYNKIHYKCMVGLFEVLMEQKRFPEAYDVVKRLSQYFPANPQRLTQVLRLAIMTASYDDVERYYRIFTNIDERNPEMVKYVCAALVICGKYYIQRGLQSRALELLTKTAITAAGNTRVLREVVQTLVDAGLVSQTKDFLKRFPPITQSQADYLAMDLLVASHSLSTAKSMEKGWEILRKDIHDPVVYKVMIQKSIEADLPKAATDLAGKASERWPEQAAKFQALLKPLADAAASKATAKAEAAKADTPKRA